MNEETLTALKESIAKWEKRASGDRSERIGLSACPLCHLFNNNSNNPDDDDCVGCPVFEKTKKSYCDETPFRTYANKRTNENAQREVDFLKSLLPSEEKKDFNWVDLEDYLKEDEKKQS